MKYRLSAPVSTIKGIGDKLTQLLEENEVKTVLDLLLYLPYRYEDRRQIVPIAELEVGEQATVKATVLRVNTQHRGRRAIVRATVEDDTGRLNCIWFNNRFIGEQLKKGEEFYLAGKFNDRNMLLQATVEKVSDDPVHTARLVPVYTQLSKNFKIGSLRRILKEVVNNLETSDDPLVDELKESYPTFSQALKVLHFPDDTEVVPAARERLALEELLSLIQHSQQLKNHWKKQQPAVALKLENYEPGDFSQWLPNSIPFELTGAQQRATREILADLQHHTAMNRLLIGDVGSGKTVVAGLACLAAVQSQHHAVIAAPTQILAHQHFESLQKLLPTINYQLLTGKESKQFKPTKIPTLYIGTHAALNQLDKIQPALIVYDEQHRFGVKQRSLPKKLRHTPHLLTMSATPIPRSLMLTLFSHLQLSVIDELPANQQPTTTWLVPSNKRESSLEWLAKQLEKTNGQALVVCPFIEPSQHESFSNVAAAKDLFKELKTFYQQHAPQLAIDLLHGQLKQTKKEQAINNIFSKKTDILVTTPVVEVGVDLPTANVIIIEAAERFGMASLHQLRGRVGRAGQASFCLLFTNAKSSTARQRLKTFTQEHDGLKLAEQDLKNRGAGDLFGFRQHGLSDLRFASWADLKLIQTAHAVFEKLKNQAWQPLISYQDNQVSTQPGAN